MFIRFYNEISGKILSILHKEENLKNPVFTTNIIISMVEYKLLEEWL